MTKYNLKNETMWAVVMTCRKKDNGIYKEFKRIIATFDDPYCAQDFINKCLPAQNRDYFEVTAL